jgi:hypothetical protein
MVAIKALVAMADPGNKKCSYQRGFSDKGIRESNNILLQGKIKG